MLTIRRSDVAELRAHEHGLVAMNMAEAHPGEPVCIDWELYERAEAANAVDVLAAWDGDQMAGYLLAMHHTHPQTGERTAVSCGLYVRPGPDAGFALRKLLRLYGELLLSTTKAERLIVDDRVNGRLGRLLCREGFRPVSTVYERSL